MIPDKELIPELLKVIKEEKLFIISDIFAFYTRINRATFYNRGLDKIDEIKKALDDNKIKTKHSLKLKWLKSDNATLQIALFKIICTDEERKAISQTYHDLGSEDGSMRPKIKLDKDTIKTIVEKL